MSSIGPSMAPLAGFEPAERRQVDVRPLGDLLKRQPPLCAELTQPPADAGVDRLFSV